MKRGAAVAIAQAEVGARVDEALQARGRLVLGGLDGGNPGGAVRHLLQLFRGGGPADSDRSVGHLLLAVQKESWRKGTGASLPATS